MGDESVGGIIGLDAFTDEQIIGSKLPTTHEYFYSIRSLL